MKSVQISISSEAFKTDEEAKSEEVFKSVGIDKEGGLVFTLDTLQVPGHLVYPQWKMKVHKAGDIPVMQV